MGFKGTIQSLEEWHQLPNGGKRMLAQKRELALHGDLIGADILQKTHNDVALLRVRDAREARAGGES